MKMSPFVHLAYLSSVLPPAQKFLLKLIMMLGTHVGYCVTEPDLWKKLALVVKNVFKNDPKKDF